MSRHVDYEEGYQPGDVVVGHTSLWRKGYFDWTIEKLLPKRRENTYKDVALHDYDEYGRDYICYWCSFEGAFVRDYWVSEVVG